ncbi:MAG TPA: hypothetical protein VNT42_09775 [Sphingomonas sp.]|nr:hypothetical protein [Sphingomonas sp.]
MSTIDGKPVARIVETLSEPQTARARVRAGNGFEAEAMVSISPVGILAVGGLMAAILLSSAAIVRAARRRVARPDQPKLP